MTRQYNTIFYNTVECDTKKYKNTCKHKRKAKKSKKRKRHNTVRPRNRSSRATKSPFPCTAGSAAHIFVSRGDAPATITQYVAWMERQFNACQTPRSMILSIFNSFRVIRCLSRCVNPKIAIFTTFFVSPGDAPGAITLR